MSSRHAELCYSVQLIEPFRTVMRTHPKATPELLALIGTLGPDQRLPISASHAMEKVIQGIIHDEDIGLRAACASQQGDYDVLEYVAASAETFRESLESSFRYTRLLNDAADFRLEIHGDKAYVILHSIVPLTRIGADFRTAAFYLTLVRWLGAAAPRLEVWFTHAAPADTRAYVETFGETKVVFGAPLDAVIFEAQYLDHKQASADPTLHRLMRAHAERLMASLPPAQSLIAQVRDHIMATMPDGSVSADRVASRLHMSRRTLTRHLADEGTSFKTLLDDSRRHSAGHYLQTTVLSIEDIAFLLGFSESAAFVRAFKRWTQSTPAEYRRAHR